MKRINYLLFSLLVCVAIASGCKSDDGGDAPNPEAEALTKLQGTWEVDVARKDNSPIDGYDNMKMIITNKSIALQDEPAESVFPEGSFTFVGDDYDAILVDEINVTLAAFTETNLTTLFALDADGNDAGRVAVVQGEYSFSFVKAE